jgi:2-oxoglutarate dehydrogenase E1 component
MTAPSDYQRRNSSSGLSSASAAYIEAYYEDYLQNPESVPAQWRDYFADLPGEGVDIAHGPIQHSFMLQAKFKQPGSNVPTLDADAADKQAKVLRLINAHRTQGHKVADIEPLGLREIKPNPELDPAHYGLTEGDMDAEFNTGSLAAADQMKLRDIVALVRGVYTKSIGAQYMHLGDTAEKRWIQARLEGTHHDERFSIDERKKILMDVTAAEGIEKYLHTKYVGQKRFSLEGGESYIAALQALIQSAAKVDVEEIVIGMAHRGRLNVLVNVMGKSPSILFEEFEGKYDQTLSAGDVKYHMGFSTDIEVEDKPVHLVLAFNPSHLEIVNPVVEGSVKARQDRRDDRYGKTILPVLVHGDSAVAGQGVVMETLQMSQLRGFSTGGTMHIVINNQVGFTTSKADDVRSTEYCSDIAKMGDLPVFHVNGDDPEAVVHVTKLAMEYRTEFKKDVFVDIVCYRRHGHNEADEPGATQPMMYSKIRPRATTRAIYAERLVKEGVLTEADTSQMIDDYRDGLDEGRNITTKTLGLVGNKHTVDWSIYNKEGWDEDVDTGVPLDKIREYAHLITDVPEGFALHNRISRVVKDRQKMAAGGLPIDWGFAETMAYASLLDSKRRIRLCGQDAGRGTFFHRHAVWHNQNNGESMTPLKDLTDRPKDFVVIDSYLSEEAVLGFEYGYSTAEPETMVIWEAQFGDFANGAQVVIDQFIASGEVKWGRMCSLSMFLPHGYEGQGPEHSSARVERYLQLCAEHNMQVIVPTTPSQMFHMIRRQMLRSFRKPLIVLTPKSLLRHRESIASLEDLVSGKFHPVISEIEDIKPEKVDRLVFCCGKVYFDLIAKRRETETENVALVRIEQLYPFPSDYVQAEIAKYPNAKDVVWCQEEPMNQGAWNQIRHRFTLDMRPDQTRHYAGRASSASTAAGYASAHARQQKELVNEALGLDLES